MKPRQQKAVIIGAGPAGLTAAYELLKTTDIKPIVFEASDYVGGISKTINYKNNRIDIGGHRFFSKSDRVMDWWLSILPLEESSLGDFDISYQNKSRTLHDSVGVRPETEDAVMLIRQRKSRIYFNRTLFDYPISLSVDTVSKLGVIRSFKMGVSYLMSVLSPIKPENTLEEFFINRFGRELYSTFFESYTEKVWGVGCREISAEWGAQRIKGLSVGSAIWHKLKSLLPGNADIRQKNTQTSLIERFLYPKFGPGQMWETVTDLILKNGGELHKKKKIVGLRIDSDHVTSVQIMDVDTRDVTEINADYVISSMPVRDLAAAISPTVDSEVRNVAQGLVYRDFITVGLLVKKLAIRERGREGNMVSDNWIYIQEPDVKLGRLQIFNNWSPHMVADPANVWLGLEYFCNEGDGLWNMENEDLVRFAAAELAKIEIIDKVDVIEGMVLREPKTYPAYFGTYDTFHVIRNYMDRIHNLFLVGRNGMHRYNNQDHSMLTAMTAVENIRDGVLAKDNIWSVNTEQDYHEEKAPR